MEINFKIGDTVIVESAFPIETFQNVNVNGKKATVLEFSDLSPYVVVLDFGENVGGHNRFGKSANGFCWNVHVQYLKKVVEDKNAYVYFFGDEEEECFVTFDGNRTIAKLEDGTKGQAKCSPEDEFDHTRGVHIAYSRAKIKQFQRKMKKFQGELKKLCR